MGKHKLEKNIKIILWISFLIIIGLFFKFYAFFIPSAGWPFPVFPYRPGILYDDVRYSSMLISFVAFIIFMFLFFNIKTNKNYKLRLKSSIIGLIVAVLSHGVFYLTNLDYVYREYPRVFMYTSSDGEYITNKERYFSLVEKYGYTIGSYAKFQTLEESIEALEFAKKQNSSGVYYRVFEDLDRFGYDKVFENYQDKTFQIYFIRYIFSENSIVFKKESFLDKNYKYLKDLYIYGTNDEIKDISIKLFKGYSNIFNNGILEVNIDDKITELDKQFNFSIRDVDGINKNIF